MGEFEGKSVIVTGGALGIGGGTSEAFADAGALVTIMDNNNEAGSSLAKMGGAATGWTSPSTGGNLSSHLQGLLCDSLNKHLQNHFAKLMYQF